MASETQTAPLPGPKFSRYRSAKRALASDALPLPLAASSVTPPPPRLDPTSHSFSRYRGTRSIKLPSTSPSNLASDSASGHGIEQAPRPKDHASKALSATRQTIRSGKHTVSLTTQRVHELSRSPEADCSNSTTYSGPTSQPKNRGGHKHTELLETASDSTVESPQSTGEYESQQQGHEGKAKHQSRQLPATQTQRTPRLGLLPRYDAGDSRQKRLREQDACGTLRADTRQLKKSESQRREKHKRSGQKRDVIESAQSFPRNSTGYEIEPLSSLGHDRLSRAIPASTGKTGETLNRTISSPVRLELGPGAVVSGLDAPLSAVNAGERRVLIRCNSSEIELPIHPTTTSLDLIRSARNVISESIQPSTSVLLESFTQLGLERRIRKYEHVRDIMNSWDYDAQNSLDLVPSATGGDDEDLDVKHVPDERPLDTSVYVYHSQKPGKWDKRWVTLRSDGQVQVAKRDGAEASNICHLSDFDIYVPTRRQMSKELRPPKKVCFAVKSQQKSSIFLSTTNFVHFFATNDKKVAALWYSAVQGWRSWYLVNVMGQGRTRDESDIKVSVGLNPMTGSGVTSETTRHRKAPSTNSIPDQIGSFRPLLPPGHFQSDLFATDRTHTSSAEAPPVTAKALHAPKLSIRGKSAPGPAVHREFTEDIVVVDSKPDTQSRPHTGGPPLQTLEATTFAPTSLLGRTYSHRQRTQFEREISSKVTNVATPLTGLLGGQSDQSMRASTDTNGKPTINRTPTSRFARKGSVGPKRIASQHQKPEPLIDLSPEYKEAPQHTRRGRGVIPHQMPPGGLVDIATSPEVLIPLPPAIAWRRPGTSNDEASSLQRTSAARPSVDATRSSVPEEVDAFTGGLLAKTGSSQGGTGRGRGVVTGDRHAKGPMLDVSEKSRFLPGSLLAHVEQNTGNGGPVIERAKRLEINMAVGEGL